MKCSGAAATVLVGLTVFLAGCDVRIDTPPPAVPTADSAESGRQSVALALKGLVQLDLDPLVETAAEAHLAALGGVWQPPDYPHIDPLIIPAPATVQAAISAITTEIGGALASVDADFAGLLGSMALYYHQISGRLFQASPPADITQPDYQWPELPQEQGIQLLEAIDALGFFWERHAATQAEYRAEAQTIARQYRKLALSLAMDLEVAGTSADPRQPIYSAHTFTAGEENGSDEAANEAEAGEEEASEIEDAMVTVFDQSAAAPSVHAAIHQQIVNLLIAAVPATAPEHREDAVALAAYFAQGQPEVAFPGLSTN